MTNLIFDPLYYVEGRNEKPKKGGSKVDTSGLEDATQQAIRLQRQMYEQGREDVQPWYDVGVSGVGRLADLLGISGGAVKTRDQIYNELLPQYTQKQTIGGNQYLTPDGQVVTAGDDLALFAQGAVRDVYSGDESDAFYEARRAAYKGRPEHALNIMGYKPYETTKEVTDYTALNEAVSARLAEQDEVPEGYGSLMERFTPDDLAEDEGYQFRLGEAEKALQRQLAAQGVTLGGAGFGEINPQAYRAMEELSQGLASQEFQNAYARDVQDKLNQYNMLMGVAGMGQGSTGLMASGGQQYAQNVGNLQTGLASAQMQADLANASQPSMFQQLSPIAGMLAGHPQAMNNAMMAFGKSDERLKENIEFVGYRNGYKVYDFDYKDGSGRFRGVMAQDLLSDEPEAVHEHESGYYMVDYSKLGFDMERV